MRLYYGWWIVVIGMLALMLTFGSTILAFGVYVLPVAKDFGISRADTNTGLILLNFGSAIVSIFVGRMLDRYSAQKILGFSGLLFAGSFVALGLSHNVWVSGAVLAIPLSIALAGAGTLTASTLVARWFTAHRGRAMAITMMGLSLGTLLVAPAVGLSVGAIGWRNTMITVGIAVGAALFLFSIFVHERPEPNEAAIENSGRLVQASLEDIRSTGSMKPWQLLRSPLLWMLGLSAALVLGALQTTAISLIPLARGVGLSVAQSASLLSSIGAMNIVGKLTLAAVADRIDRVVLLTALFVMVACANAALLIANSFITLVLCSAGVGLAAGAITPAFLAVLADRFGKELFGTVNGMVTFMLSVVGAILVRFGGEVFDRTGGYTFMFVTFIGIALVSALLMLATRYVGKTSAVIATRA